MKKEKKIKKGNMTEKQWYSWVSAVLRRSGPKNISPELRLKYTRLTHYDDPFPLI